MNMKKKKNNLKPQANDAAANLIRSKLDNAYASEPDVKKEAEEIKALGAHSKHQLHMKKLLSSGRSYLDIQAAWHSYYLALPDEEKHQVWREFYSQQNRQTDLPTPNEYNHALKNNHFIAGGHGDELSRSIKLEANPNNNNSDLHKLKRNLKNKISADGKLTARHHLKSLLFGLSLAGAFALISGFVLFNQIFVGPFIRPSVKSSSTPIISINSDVNVSPEPKIIIPKLNVEAPIITDVADRQESTVQNALQKGVVLFPDTGKPGELGNQVIFGHSSNNLFNRGDYKYVFVLLNKMESGDIIYVNYLSKQYTYRVITKKIIKPSEVGVLTEQPVPALITLITCDPPGSNVNRLVVQAEQINPKPETNKPSTASNSSQPTTLAGSPESFFRRILNIIF